MENHKVSVKNNCYECKHNCYECKHRRNIPGTAHISCANPDPAMTGHPHGIRFGWFSYPFCFDPVWVAKICDNFMERV